MVGVEAPPESWGVDRGRAEERRSLVGLAATCHHPADLGGGVADPGLVAWEGWAMADWNLRSAWMTGRLRRMTDLLRERGQSMPEYADGLRALERGATPANPMPALDAIIADHRATGWKTVSVSVRVCVGGSCFPIDSRVAKELGKHDLPVNERELVSLSLGAGRNPRQVARLFFAARDG